MEYHVTSTFLQVYSTSKINVLHVLCTNDKNTFKTSILTGVGYMSLLFDVDNFTDRIMVTLTTLLVTVTMGSSIQSVSDYDNNSLTSIVHDMHSFRTCPKHPTTR